MSVPAPAPAPAKARAAVVAAAVLLVVLVCGTGTAQMLSQVVRATLERTSTITPATDRFVLEAGVGDVTPSADAQVHVRTVVHHGLGEPELVEESTPTGVRASTSTATTTSPAAARSSTSWRCRRPSRCRSTASRATWSRAG